MPTCRSVLRYWVRLAVIGTMLHAASACGDDSTAPSPEREDEPTLAIVSGDGQSAEVASALPQPLVVVLRGSRRAPIAGVLVRFVDENGVVGDSVLTDSRGSASARWTLGPKAKTQRISAVATISRGDTNTFADTAFTATALAGPAAQIRLHTTADIAAPGSPLDTVFAVMTDRFENRVPYAVIGWIVELGGGSVRALTPKTDVDGVARALWTLGTGTGENVLVATSGPLATRLKGFASVGFPATSIVVGEEHACALTPLGATYCWGSNASGQLGVGTADNQAHTSPSRVTGSVPFTQLVAGGFHTCGLTADGVAHCWGENNSGQLGIAGDRAVSPTRVATAQTFTALAAGANFTCGLTTQGIIYCWGDNTIGALGDGIDRSTALPWGVAWRTEPAPIAGGRSFRALAAMSTAICAVATTGQTYCWGSNQDRQLGTASGNCRMAAIPYYYREDWDIPCSTIPVAIDSQESLTSLSAGNYRVCGLTTARGLMCWGVSTPPFLIPGARVSAAWSLDNFVCGVEDTEAVTCWSLLRIPDRTPPPFGDGVTLVRLSTRNLSSCGVSRSQPPAAYCWGPNSKGQVGDGTTAYRYTAVAVGLPRTTP